MNSGVHFIPPSITRGLLAVAVAGGIIASLGGGVASAEAPGIPVPTNASVIDSQTVRVYWRNTANEDRFGDPFGTGESAAWFNLRYRRSDSVRDAYSSYSYIGGGGAPDDRGLISPNPLPSSSQQGEILSYDVGGLQANTSYCFSARAYAHEDGEPYGTFSLSPWSGEVCGQTLPATLVIDENALHLFEAAQLKPPSDPKSSTVPGLGPALKPNPDLVAVGINGPQTLQDGIAQTYQAVIRNDGSATFGMDVQLNLSGSLEAWSLPQPASADGMNCSMRQTPTGTSLLCTGGPIAAAQTVTVQFQAHAAKTGAGDISMVLNPNRTLTEMDYNNNVAVVHITVH
jgi:hypothetical protein